MPACRQIRRCQKIAANNDKTLQLDNIYFQDVLCKADSIKSSLCCTLGCAMQLRLYVRKYAHALRQLPEPWHHKGRPILPCPTYLQGEVAPGQLRQPQSTRTDQACSSSCLHAAPSLPCLI